MGVGGQLLFHPSAAVLCLDQVLDVVDLSAPTDDPCRYAKGAWSECDTKTNTRTRTLTLKKGDAATCEQTKTIQKKCKKGMRVHVAACRYDKGTWGDCANGRMTRTDALRPNSDPSCEQARQITKKCKPKGQKKTKGRRARAEERTAASRVDLSGEQTQRRRVLLRHLQGRTPQQAVSEGLMRRDDTTSSWETLKLLAGPFHHVVTSYLFLFINCKCYSNQRSSY
ncbi:Pleiotrophin [Frankliniella fusca]|uniref:Pleiotrophin n=1 Tax=Frankliniella fusca TaxID=407009 RepID=A0AAE1LIW5_9NEOP|nr:Pleiotrophin [Frankliniella fusca]